MGRGYETQVKALGEVDVTQVEQNNCQSQQQNAGGIWERLAWLDADRLVTVIVFLGLVAMAVRPPADTDTWWHLRSGQYIVETGSIPFEDPFSHTVYGKAWIDHGWLAQVGLYLTYRSVGMAGLSLALAGGVVLAFWFVYRRCAGNRYLCAFALVLAALTSAVTWVARPQILSFLFTSIFLYVLHRFKHRGANRLYLLPLLFLLWVNVHGGFIIGFAVLMAYVVGEALNNAVGVGIAPILDFRRIRLLLATTLASVVVVLVNPHTYKMLGYPFFTVGMGALQNYIEEWGSPDFHLLYQQPFLWLLFAAVVAMALSRSRVDFTDLVLFAGFGYMALVAVRNFALFALVAAPVLTQYGDSALDNLFDAWRKRTPWGHWLDRLAAHRFQTGPLLTLVNVLLLVLVVFGCAVAAYRSLASVAAGEVVGGRLPVQAVSFIARNELPGELFNSYNWGGYLIWRLYPGYRVFIDGRTDLYDDAFIQRYLQVIWVRKGWREVLADYGVNTVLVERDGILASFLGNTSGWVPVYIDDVAAVFVRDSGENQYWISEHRLDWSDR